MVIILGYARHVLELHAVEHSRRRRIGYVEERQLEAAVIFSAVAVVARSVPDTEQAVIACRDEKGGEAVYLDFAFDARTCRVGQVDYEERVDSLIGDHISLVSYEAYCLDALVARESGDFAGLFQL